MRTTITIPDEFYKSIKDKYEAKGFVTINDYLLDLVRKDNHQSDAGITKEKARITEELVHVSMLDKSMPTELPSVINVDLNNINFPTAEQLADPNFGLARKRATSKCSPQNATCKFFGTKYRVTYPSDEGEIKKDVFLREYHVKKAIDSGLEVMEK